MNDSAALLNYSYLMSDSFSPAETEDSSDHMSIASDADSEEEDESPWNQRTRGREFFAHRTRQVLDNNSSSRQTQSRTRNDAPLSATDTPRSNRSKGKTKALIDVEDDDEPSPSRRSGLRGGDQGISTNNESPTSKAAQERDPPRAGTRARRSRPRPAMAYLTAIHRSSNTVDVLSQSISSPGKQLSASPSSGSRGGRPSGPLTSSRVGHRRSTRRSSSSDDIPVTTRRSTRPMASDLLSKSPHTNFPSFRGIARLNGYSKKEEPTQFFDCKFYPYTAPGVDPLFAFVGGSEIGIARPSLRQDECFEIVKWLHEDPVEPLQNNTSDDEEPVRTSTSKRGRGRQSTNRPKPLEPISLNSCAWMQDPVTKAPLLAVSGKPATIKIIDVLTGEHVARFTGHGKEVNDLTVSPLSSSILASASGDQTVRIWTLDPKYRKQPCMLMCAGEGHKQGLLTLAFHQKGSYLLTGGIDNAVCLWSIPSLPNEQTGTDKPTMLHFPHFRTAAIHQNFVDCVAFHHDLVISKCARENKIVIWRIEGFDSRRDPPTLPPTNDEDSCGTRSAWGGKYQRLTQLDVSDSTAFYIRFSLFSFPGERPVLAIGNERSKVFFWDLKSLEEWVRPDPATMSANEQAAQATGRGSRGGGRRKARGRARMMPQFRDASVASDGSSAKTDVMTANSMGFGAVDAGNRWYLSKKFQMEDPFKVLDPHRTHTVQKVFFACRQVAWSVGGEWMVVVGDQGMLGVFHRDRPKAAM